MKNIFLSLIVLSSFAALPASALTVDLDSSVKSDTNATAGTASGTQANENAVINANVNANLGVGADAHTTSSTSLETNRGATDDHADMRARALAVRTDAELNAYVQNLKEDGDAVEEVEVGERNVAITYRRAVRLFGFIDTWLRETAEVAVDADGTVTTDVGRSWWSAFASADVDEADIKAKIEAKLKEMEILDSENKISASAKAKILAELRAEGLAETTTTSN